MRAIFKLLVFTFLLGCENPEEETDAESEGAVPGSETSDCLVQELPEASSATGQLTFVLDDEGLDPCSVAGYVVGYDDVLTVERASGNTYFISNIPAGEHDVVIMASSAVPGLRESRRGRRLRKLRFLAGIRTEKGSLDLPAVGSLTGKVTLVGETDHSGVHVYLPGTGFDATSDSEGHYSISPFVVAGETNIYFDNDGYHRGQIEQFEIVGGEENTAPSLTLVLSTGAEGLLLIENGAAAVNTRAVSINVGATPDAVLMKISESPTFDSISWEPIVSTTSYNFSSDGEKTLYIKFADANGLESSPYNDSIVIDTTAPTVDSFGVTSLIANDERTHLRDVNLTYTIANEDLEYQASESSGFENAVWATLDGNPQLRLSEGEGQKTVYFRVRDSLGNISGAVNDSITLGLTWGNAFLLENSSGSTSSQMVDINVSGDGQIIWTEPVGGVGKILGRTITNFGTIGDAEEISTNASGSVWPNGLRVDANGNKLVVYRQDNHMYYRRYDASTTSWNTPAAIEALARSASIAYLSEYVNGEAMLVWVMSDSTTGDLFASRFTDGGGWSAPEQLNSGVGRIIGTPYVDGDNSGGFMAVWGQYDCSIPCSPNTNLWYSVYTSGSGWGAEAIFQNNADGLLYGLEYDEDGDSVVIWEASGLFSKTYDGSGSSWSSLITVSNDTGQKTPYMTSNNKGQAAIATWKNQSNSFYSTSASFFEKGQGWTTLEVISTVASSVYVYSQSLDMNGNGETMFTWFEKVPVGATNMELKARLRNGNGWQDTETLGQGYAPINPLTFQSAFSQNGYAIRVFEDQASALDSYGIQRLVPE